MAFKLGEAFIQLNTRGMAAVQTQMQGLKSRMGSWLGIAGAGGAIYGFYRLLKSTIGEAIQMQRADSFLAYSLKQVGDESGKGAKRLKLLASELQSITGYNDEATKSAMALLATYRMSESQIRKAIPLILDMAAATEKSGNAEADLQSIAMLIGRAFAGSTAMLARYGIVLDKSYQTTKDFNLVLAALSDRFSGQAQILGTDYLGKLRRFKAEWSDVKQVIGSKLLPVLDRVLLTIRLIASEQIPIPAPAPALRESIFGRKARLEAEIETMRAARAEKAAAWEHVAGVYSPEEEKDIRALALAIRARRLQLHRIQTAEKIQAAQLGAPETRRVLAGYRAPVYGERGIPQPVYQDQKKIVNTLEEIEKHLREIKTSAELTRLGWVL